MADPRFVITEAGIAAANVATPTGPFISIVEFRVGSGFGYEPSAGDTDLHGTLFHSGVPFNYTVIDSDTLDIVCIMEPDVGPFSFGEIGLYLPGGVLFALAAYDTPQQKLKSLGNQIGSRWKIHALLKLEQAPAIIQVTITQSNQILEVPNWASLVAPISQLSGANAVIVHEPDPVGQTPLVIRKADLDWSIMTHRFVGSGTINSATTGSVTSNDFLQMPLDMTTSGRYVIKFLATGLIRAITSFTTNTAFLASTIAIPSGTFEIHESLYYADEDAYASKTEFNELVNKYNVFWSTPSGTPQNNIGLNQTSINLVTTLPTLANWTELFDKVTKGAKLTGTDFASLTVDDFRVKKNDPNGLKTKITRYNALELCVDSTIANHNLSDPAFQETNTPAGGTATHSGSTWVDKASVIHTVTLDYGSANELAAIFNGGGSVQFWAKVEGSQNGQEFSWQDFLFANGTIKMFYDKTTVTSGLGTLSALGFYDLTGSYQTLYTRSVAATVGNITYSVEGRQNTSTQLQFRITFASDTTPGPYSGATTAVLTSTTVLSRPASSIILDPVLAYPSAGSTGIA